MKMSSFALPVIALSLLAGCASTVNPALAEKERTLARLDGGARTVICEGAQECTKAFALTKLYVAQTADMRVAHEGELVVQTFPPHNTSHLGLEAHRVPGTGEFGEIRLTAVCPYYSANVGTGWEGSARSSSAYGECLDKLIAAYSGFKPFVAARIGSASL